MHQIITDGRHFIDRPFMLIALIVLGLGLLDMVYALAPSTSLRHRVLKVLFWLAYPILVLTFFSGRTSRQDRDTHIIYAFLVLLVGLFLFIAAAFF